jgi:GntR family transcriptional regulator
MVDPRPPHQKIAAELRAQIMDRSIRGQLPKTEELKRANNDIGNSTITKALNTLRDEGLTKGVRGAGVYAVDGAVSIIDATAYVPPGDGRQYLILEVAESVPPGDVQEVLGADTAIVRRRLTILHGSPLEIANSYYAVDVARRAGLDAKSKLKGGAPAALAAIGLPQRVYQDVTESRQPTSAELEVLQLPPDVPVLRVLRTVWSDDDRVVEVDVILKGGHRFKVRSARTAIE